VLMDVRARRVRGWHLGRGRDQEWTQTAWRRAFEHGRPEVHHADQGVQHAATAHVELLRSGASQISMASVGEPEENGDAERLLRTITEEEVDLSESEDFGDAPRALGRFLDGVDNRQRIHSSLGYLTQPYEGGAIRLLNCRPSRSYSLPRRRRPGPRSTARSAIGSVPTAPCRSWPRPSWSIPLNPSPGTDSSRTAPSARIHARSSAPRSSIGGAWSSAASGPPSLPPPRPAPRPAPPRSAPSPPRAITARRPAPPRASPRPPDAWSRAVAARPGGAGMPLLPGARVPRVDGHHRAGTAPRHQPPRTSGAGARPGPALVVVDPGLRRLTDVLPGVDGPAQERWRRARLPPLPLVRAQDRGSDDRNFSTTDPRCGSVGREGWFVVRQDAATWPWPWVGQRRACGRIATGHVFAPTIGSRHAAGAVRFPRRVTVALDQPTRDGDTAIPLRTKVPVRDAPAATIAERCRARWRIATAVRARATAPRGAVDTRGAPPAARFGICVALVADPAPRTVQAGLRSAAGERVVAATVSDDAVAEAVPRTRRGRRDRSSGGGSRRGG
jgi:Integrase core domain